ncbi:MAG: glycoside hydrolase family 99-like domain-containing protein [Muribaculaceae bacterium]|nr:glycoside hydrolase family 99-like domain-containing protein [Muribaculaceae bacterium]
MNQKTKVIAFYLPQFHPIPENDEWWGKGFTEWTNVARAQKFYKSHYQPKIPADLGFYDLRVPETRAAQAELAKEAGVTAFCYWHYWLGNGKQLLEKPLQEVLRLGEPDFPFMLGWANHSWVSRDWNLADSMLSKKILIEQTYPGEQDIINHFYTMLPVFKDNRYIKIHDKLPFLIYKIEDIPDFNKFSEIWNKLAKENGLPPFFFIAHTHSIDSLHLPIYQSANARCLCRHDPNFLTHKRSFISRLHRFIKSNYLKIPVNVHEYSDIIKEIDTPLYEEEKIYPSIVPNWDPSPRRGGAALIYHNSTPELFYKHVKKTLDRIKNKADEDKVIFLKSWNEWAEGNYMEPDLKYGKGYIKALRKALDEFENQIK